MKSCDQQYYFGKPGEKLFVQEWGSQESAELHKPVVLLVHGFPGCADHGKLMSGSPLWNSFRLISMDRPGYGKSEAQKSITPLKFAQQIEQLLAHKKIDQVSVISVSGGAPYSMAIAYLLKNRVRKLTSIGGIAPLTLQNFKYMNKQQKKTWFLRNLVPETILHVGTQRAWKQGMEKLNKYFFTEMDSFSPADQLVFRDPVIGPELLKSMNTSLHAGPSGILVDMKVYSRPWGFPLSEITCPVTLWHGSADDVVHHKFAEDMRRKLPYAKLNFIDNQGHYSLLLNCRDEILGDLLDHRVATSPCP